MARDSKKPVSKGGSHGREPQASLLPAFPRRIPVGDERAVPLGALFAGESRRCACGRTGTDAWPLRWVTTEVRDRDEEGAERMVTRAAWMCGGCRQLAFEAFEP